MRPLVSVVISARNEYPNIVHTVHSILNDLETFLRPGEFEVIIVDNCSDDGENVKRAVGGQTARLAGLVIARQRPSTAMGSVFATLEDEEGFVDLLLHENVYEKHRDVFSNTLFIVVTGKVQRDRGAVTVVVQNVKPLFPEFDPDETRLRAPSRDFR